MDLVLNLDQTPYVLPGKYSFNPIGATTVPIEGMGDKRQVTATFNVIMNGKSLPIQKLSTKGKRADAFIRTKALILAKKLRTS